MKARLTGFLVPHRLSRFLQPSPKGHWNNRQQLLDLDLNIHAGRQVETHEHVDGLWIGFKHVDQTIVGADLKVLVGVFINEGWPANGVLLDAGGQGHRANNLGATAFRSLNDALCALIQNAMIICFVLPFYFLFFGCLKSRYFILIFLKFSSYTNQKPERNAWIP